MTAETAYRYQSSELSDPRFLAFRMSDLAQGGRRLDAEVYLTSGFMVRQAIEHSSFSTYDLGECAKVWQPNRLKGIEVDREYGVPYLAATQTFDIWPTSRRWLAANKIADIESLYVSPGWILVTRSGTVGETIVSYSIHTECVISDDLLRVEVEDCAMRNYVYAFLRTRFGRSMMRSSHYGSVVKHLEVSHLEELPVPIVELLYDEIHISIAEAYECRNEAALLDRKARQNFEARMAYWPDVVNDKGYSISASDLFYRRRRLEGAAYSPRAQQLVELYHGNANDIEILAESCRTFVPGRFKRIYGPEGVPYLDSEPIFKINPELSKFLTSATPIDFDTYKVERGWLLMACSGQVYGINGQAIVANEMHEGKVVTQHIMRIVPSGKIRSGYLQTVLSHPTLGKPLVVSRAYGTSVPELAAEDIAQLPIPRLDKERSSVRTEQGPPKSKVAGSNPAVGAWLIQN